ncbi:UNKNOWN [Stylonychia lemnae]|uniref:Uncharacterized protein n=1 Tax=Stylonychia lemnae TaxID=5949 RepID=A0A078ANK2_STYLE|nr:UNKNOWN [Stylonychia lemnae]|eukprot:CDW82548.1 UNKNOWN [Stylonychia lemnae]
MYVRTMISLDSYSNEFKVISSILTFEFRQYLISKKPKNLNELYDIFEKNFVEDMQDNQKSTLAQQQEQNMVIFMAKYGKYIVDEMNHYHEQEKIFSKLNLGESVKKSKQFIDSKTTSTTKNSAEKRQKASIKASRNKKNQSKQKPEQKEVEVITIEDQEEQEYDSKDDSEEAEEEDNEIESLEDNKIQLQENEYEFEEDELAAFIDEDKLKQ